MRLDKPSERPNTCETPSGTDARHRPWVVRQSLRFWTACLTWSSPHREHYPHLIALADGPLLTSVDMCTHSAPYTLSVANRAVDDNRHVHIAPRPVYMSRVKYKPNARFTIAA